MESIGFVEPNRAKDMEAVGLVEPNTKNQDMETMEFVGPKTDANDMESIGFVEPNRAKDMEAAGLVEPNTKNQEHGDHGVRGAENRRK